jgi:hypothetical protein
MIKCIFCRNTGCQSQSQSQSHIATDGQSISKSWCEAPSGAHDQIFNSLWQLRSCFSGEPSLTRRQVSLLYMLLALTSLVFPGSVSFGTCDHILLSQILRLSFSSPPTTRRVRWRYSKPPPYGLVTVSKVKVKVILRPTVSRLVCLGVKHPFGAYYKFFITARQLRVCWCGALTLTRERICHLQLLLVLASAAILVSKSRRILTIFYCLIFETPPTWRARSPYLYPSGTGWPSYTLSHWNPFSSPPTTRRATVEVFEPASTRGGT